MAAKKQTETQADRLEKMCGRMVELYERDVVAREQRAAAEAKRLRDNGRRIDDAMQAAGFLGRLLLSEWTHSRRQACGMLPMLEVDVPELDPDPLNPRDAAVVSVELENGDVVVGTVVGNSKEG